MCPPESQNALTENMLSFKNKTEDLSEIQRAWNPKLTMRPSQHTASKENALGLNQHN